MNRLLLAFSFASVSVLAACPGGDDPVDSQPPVAVDDLVSVDEDAEIVIDVLANDSDPAGRPLSLVRATAIGHAATIDGGRVRVATEPNWNGEIAVSYVLAAGEDSVFGRAVVTVVPVNDAPVARAATINAPRNLATAIRLEGSDVDGDAITYEVASGPAHGTLSGTAPALMYTPTAGYIGDDAIVFHARDAATSSAAATIAISVLPGTAPQPQTQFVETPEDSGMAVTLAATDADGDAVTFTVVGQPLNGTLSGTAPNLTYTPRADFHGSDYFSFTASDGTFTSGNAHIMITVTPVNDAPVAAAQLVGGIEDLASVFTLFGSDVDLDTLTFTIVDAPTRGTLTGTGTMRTYQPSPNLYGADSFTYTVSDGTATSAPATVSINISPMEDAPVAIAQVVAATEDTPLQIVLTGSDADGDTLAFQVTSIASHGVVEGTAPLMLYRPYPDDNGQDAFNFRVNDGDEWSPVATVTIALAAVDDAPVVPALSVVGPEDEFIAVPLHATDRDGEPVTYTVVTPPVHGTLTGSGPNLQYRAINYNGLDAFTLTATDGHTTSAPRQISVRVTEMPDDPIARDDVAVAQPGQAIEIDVMANDEEVDNEVIFIESVSTPSQGTVINDFESVFYTPAAGQTAQATFTYTLLDSSGRRATATVTVGVGQLPAGLPLAFVGLGVDVPDLIHSFEQQDISGDGRYVAFTSTRALSADDTNQTNDIYVWDRVSLTYERVSVPGGGGLANAFSTRPAISGDGRFVAFLSSASNLVPGDTNGHMDVFVRDRVAGTTVRASVSSTGAQASGFSSEPKISADGSVVAFLSNAADLVPDDANSEIDIFVRDLAAGTTTRVSVSSAGGEANHGATTPALSGSGQVVAFVSYATNLVPGDTNNTADVFVHDRTTGITERVSVATNGHQSDGPSDQPVLSVNGRYVGFKTNAMNLGSPGGPVAVFVVHSRDELETTVVAEAGVHPMSMSDDGRYIAVSHDDGSCFVRDWMSGHTRLFSNAGGADVYHPIISRDGRYVAVLSNAALLPEVAAGTKVFVFPNAL